MVLVPIKIRKNMEIERNLRELELELLRRENPRSPESLPASRLMTPVSSKLT
jgi:hypothetical protein